MKITRIFKSDENSNSKNWKKKHKKKFHSNLEEIAKSLFERGIKSNEALQRELKGYSSEEKSKIIDKITVLNWQRELKNEK